MRCRGERDDVNRKPITIFAVALEKNRLGVIIEDDSCNAPFTVFHFPFRRKKLFMKQHANTKGNGVPPKNRPRSRRKRIGDGDVQSEWQLGLESSSDIVDRLRKKAEDGDAAAQCKLGLYFYSVAGGELLGLERYENLMCEAIKWFRKAAEQGYSNAQYNLAICYYYGNGVEQDYEEAVRWLQKAVEQGNAAAQCMLGARYYDGKGIKQDYKEAVRWFLRAALQGSATAQYNLGRCIFDGKGAKEDHEEAVKWIRKAAKQGNEDAKMDLLFWNRMKTIMK